MPHHFDTIVIGLGAVGAATLYQLAQRGASVLGLDQFQPPHSLGSSHGQTRITRLAVGEGDEYVPLVRRSHEIWRELEAATGQSIYTRTHGLVLGPRDGGAVRAGKPDDFVGRTIAIAQRHGIAHEVLDHSDLRRRYPQFQLNDNEFAYWERDAGFVRPEAAISAQLQQAQVHGATVQTGVRVTGLARESDHLRVVTTQGTYSAGQVVLAAGPWLPGLLGQELQHAWAPQLSVYRQVMFWFDVGAATPSFEPGAFPVFIWTFRDGPDDSIYGFPVADAGVPAFKVATAQYLATTTPDTVDRAVADAEKDGMLQRHVLPRFHAPAARCTDARACLYTVTPDHGFVVDRLPGWPGVHVASACSGHGFKHSAAVGEALAQQVLGEAGGVDLRPFGHAVRGLGTAGDGRNPRQELQTQA
ncbi:N-methyl-L-tryptophan oxidase [Acidovorax sp. LjRoot118]|uniref:N-methyl-L-tryptophan oxidase n=1 Tax=Acidovorax sp. LjRoot118 TaxID=3342256 RepID=UPI003ECFE503